MSSDVGILVVDDEQIVRQSLAGWLAEDGYRVGTASSAQEALQLFAKEPWHVAIIDIKMPGMDGLEMQRRLKEVDEYVVVIIITAYASVDTAVQALKEGAYDYLTKPFDPENLSHVIQNAVQQRRLMWENAQLRQSLDDKAERSGSIVGESGAIGRVLDQVQQVAQTDATVLITGESGTGKELVAQEIHRASRRRYLPIVTVNCGALTENLIESELFGHERGAFTGAQYRKKGKFELADGGTLFLDEIGDIAAKTQADLLRVLETKEFTRVGGTKTIRSDFRLISATNQNLHELMRQNTFRLDLYYRLNAFTIQVPPLRERLDDLPLLVEHFRAMLSRDLHKPVNGFSSGAMAKLQDYTWPGNVRELRHVIEHAIVVCREPTIDAEDVELPFDEPSNRGPRSNTLSEVERDHIQEVLERTQWNITHAARILGIDRVTLYNKIKRYELQRPVSFQ